MGQITKIRIHPAIGIARLGNHPTAYFIGPEKPYFVTPPPPDGYKAEDEGTRKIKRDAARFRLYGYDENDQLVQEITAADAKISWTVHLANTKGSWRQFDALNPDAPLRNRVNTPPNERHKLNIDPGPRTITSDGGTAKFDTGSFTEWNNNGDSKTLENIYLGEIKTDTDGRLLVLGGYGKARSPWNTPLTGTFNNDGWHDDISDGPVDATVTLLSSGEPVPVVGAWVLCVPPQFAPPVGNVVTLYDTLYQKFRDDGQYDEFVASGLMPPVNDPPLWNHDVYPLLKRVFNISWVIDIAGHRSEITESILDPKTSVDERRRIFPYIRDPEATGITGLMPRLLGDVPSEFKKSPLTLTPVQYKILKYWKDNVEGSTPPSADEIAITPQGLDRAALESCVGGGFHPGIEASWFVRDKYKYAEPFRFSRDQNLAPGDISKQMAIPWHTDMHSCDKQELGFSIYGFWPGVRPDDVIPEGKQDPKSVRRPWLQGWVNNREEMIDNWFQLGIVVEVSSDPILYTETERNDPPVA